MPRIRRIGLRTRETHTHAQRMELILGPDAGPSAFASKEARLEAWTALRSELLADGFCSSAFNRPWAFFAFECRKARLWVNEPNENYFERCGLLTPEERLILKRLRSAGKIPPKPITAAPASPLLRYFRYDGETPEEFGARLAGVPSRFGPCGA